MSNVNNPWFGISLALVGVIVGYAVATGMGTKAAPSPAQPTQIAQQPSAAQPTQAPPAPSADNVPPIDADEDHIRGNTNAKVSIIEYSDFECPFCKRHHPTMTQLMDKYGDDVNWVYRHFPLSFHPNAEPAGLASECVNELGGNDAFWSFADTIFETQGEWAYEKYVSDLGLDTNAFNDCIESKKYAQHLQDDMSGGSAAGVNGTPGNIIVNNATGETRLVSGAQPIGSFTSIIDQMLADKAEAKAPSPSTGEKRNEMVHVTNWAFTPASGELRAKQGDDFTITLMGMEGNHGFAIPELGVNAAIPQGKNVTVTIPTDKPGTYTYFCNVQCGPGHADMEGQIVIDPA